MPTYDYECRSCRGRFEFFQKITEEPIKICPKCKGELKRLISAGAGIIFKGSGFYATDYRKGKASENSCPSKGQSEACKSCPGANPGAHKK